MTWNLRLVLLTTPTEEVYMELREVFYDDEGVPVGHSRATVGGETLDEVQQYLDRAHSGIMRPILRNNDFVGKFKELDDEWN